MDKINADWARDVPCRNITIHGYCKYEGKGCSFKHETAKSASILSTTTTPNNGLPTQLNNLTLQSNISTPASALDSLDLQPTGDVPKKKFDPASVLSFTPSPSIPPPGLSKQTNKFANSSNLQDIPSFVPSGTVSSSAEPLEKTSTPFNIDSPAFQPSQPFQNISSPVLSHQFRNEETLSSSQINPYAPSSEIINPYSSGQNHQDFLYQQTAYPLQYHLYSPAPPPHLQIPLKGNEQNASSLFIPNKLRELLLKKNEATIKTLGQSNLPDIVGAYFNLVPLDNSLEKSDRNYGYTSSIYKAFSNNNGNAYALRRIEDVKISKDKSLSAINNWIQFRNSNTSQVVDAFTSRAFGDNSLIVVYDYYPLAKSLFEQHFTNLAGKPEPITHDLLWTYLIQISSGIAASHAKGLPVRSISLQKLIVTSKNRIRISDVGVFDILHFDEDLDEETLKNLFVTDLEKLGHVILQLASATVSATLRSLPPLELVKHLDIDNDLKDTLIYLLSGNSSINIGELQRLIAPRIYTALNSTQESADYYEAQLTREIENARLFRLLSKLNFVLDRSDHSDLGQQWLPTGDRYPIKLFHQYVFNQVNEKGKPTLDLTHVLRSLNKLDAGVEEKILLVSSDEQSCLIVSFKEIKDLVERSFHELSKEF